LSREFTHIRDAREGTRDYVPAVSESGSAELVPVDCECAADCGENVLVTIDEYEAAHKQADYVLVRLGHPVKAGSRGSRVVTETDRYAVVAEGWALTDDEIAPSQPERLAELRATSLLTVYCECAQCDDGPLIDAAQVEVTLDEWDRLGNKRLIKSGHPTDGATILAQNDRFVLVSDQHRTSAT
jgi:hypothetical protein